MKLTLKLICYFLFLFTIGSDLVSVSKLTLRQKVRSLQHSVISITAIVILKSLALVGNGSSDKVNGTYACERIQPLLRR